MRLSLLQKPILYGRLFYPTVRKVWLNHSSILKYPKKFTEKKRVVELEGEAYFEVTKDTKRPFSVQNETLDVQVLGTVFNMNCDKNRQLAEVSLIRGSVKVTGKHRRRNDCSFVGTKS